MSVMGRGASLSNVAWAKSEDGPERSRVVMWASGMPLTAEAKERAE